MMKITFDPLPRRFATLSAWRWIAFGAGAPALLALAPSIEIRALRRGETLDHAWNSVGRHLSRGMRQASDERRITQRLGFL